MGHRLFLAYDRIDFFEYRTEVKDEKKKKKKKKKEKRKRKRKLREHTNV